MPRVLNVGQCSFDHGTIVRHLKAVYGAEVIGADTANEALVSLRAGSFDLVLVNRVLDSDGTAGLDLIRALRVEPQVAQTPVMLVSNFAQAQAEAQNLGALPGFGKADLRPGARVASLDAALGKVETSVSAPPTGPDH